MTPEELYKKYFGNAESVKKESVIKLLRHFEKAIKHLNKEKVENCSITFLKYFPNDDEIEQTAEEEATRIFGKTGNGSA